MTATKLALLLDECVTEPLANAIKNGSGTISVEHIDSSHQLWKKSDEMVMEYATNTGRIVVTTDERLDESRFPICTHPGIIIIKSGNRHAFSRRHIFKKFMLSGHRQQAKHAVTRLKSSGSFIKRLRPDSDTRLHEIPLDIRVSP